MKRKVEWNGIVGIADFNIPGFKICKTVMFYPDGSEPFYRRCVYLSECIVLDQENTNEKLL